MVSWHNGNPTTNEIARDHNISWIICSNCTFMERALQASQKKIQVCFCGKYKEMNRITLETNKIALNSNWMSNSRTTCPQTAAAYSVVFLQIVAETLNRNCRLRTLCCGIPENIAKQFHETPKNALPFSERLFSDLDKIGLVVCRYVEG